MAVKSSPSVYERTLGTATNIDNPKFWPFSLQGHRQTLLSTGSIIAMLIACSARLVWLLFLRLGDRQNTCQLPLTEMHFGLAQLQICWLLELEWISRIVWAIQSRSHILWLVTVMIEFWSTHTFDALNHCSILKQICCRSEEAIQFLETGGC